MCSILTPGLQHTEFQKELQCFNILRRLGDQRPPVTRDYLEEVLTDHLSLLLIFENRYGMANNLAHKSMAFHTPWATESVGEMYFIRGYY